MTNDIKLKTFIIVRYREYYETFSVSAKNKTEAKKLVYSGKEEPESVDYRSDDIIDCDVVSKEQLLFANNNFGKQFRIN